MADAFSPATIFNCITLLTDCRNRSKLIGLSKKSTAFKSKPSTAYFLKAVVKITFGGFLSVLKKLVPKICGMLISRNNNSTELFWRNDKVSTAFEHSPDRCNRATPSIYFLRTSLARGSSSITRQLIFLACGICQVFGKQSFVFLI